MTIRTLLTIIVLLSLPIAGLLPLPEPSRAQDDFLDMDMDGDAAFEEFMGEIKTDKEDQRRCRGSDDVSAAEQAAACTRLIEKAPNENDLVGEYYVDRAMARQTRAEQCEDVRKGIAIIERSKSTIYGGNFLEAARQLEQAACD